MQELKQVLDEKCITAIRMLAADAVEKARSGHPGMPLGAAPLIYVLWNKFLKHNPSNPHWFDRDRFILSAGHGSALLYAMLHLTGYDVSLEEIKNFRQWGSKTAGHPEYGHTPGVEATTGPLGQGFGMGVGMAIAEQVLARQFNREQLAVVDHYTYAIVSDGDLMEGISSEAASLAGFLKLGKLIYLYDQNFISIEGSTDLTFTEDIQQRFTAHNWHVVKVDDGNNIESLETAIREAQQVKNQPSLIIARTHIGYGSPKQDNQNSHGEPLGTDAMAATRKFFGWGCEPFHIPQDVAEYMHGAVEKGKQFEKDWQSLFEHYKQTYPSHASLLEKQYAGELPENWDDAIKNFVFSTDEKPMATRTASGKIMNLLAEKIPHLIGGSADLAPSTKTFLSKYGSLGSIHSDGKEQRNIHFGVREHAMGAAVNGMALHGGIIPYGSTFLVFSDYMRPSIRLAALMNVHSLFVFTHDSIGVGEDGPTHQPIEHVMSLRLIPNLLDFRPGDANETLAAWRLAVELKRPAVFFLSRQNLPVLDTKRYPVLEGVSKGAYILSESGTGKPDIILLATGSEVFLAVQAQEQLKEKGIHARVVSMPSWKLFEEQSLQYRNAVLLPAIKKRIAIEAGITLGWQKWVGSEGAIIGIDRFGASAPGEIVMKQFGFSVDAIVKHSCDLLS
ncbi:MAG: transketolase [bacterium]|nr:transketolase [bacterium]